jgi:steroid delta-isomerase-like uncharacterized protein
MVFPNSVEQVMPMAASEEAVVRRFYDEMCTGRRLELAEELFTADHVMHDPQVSSGPGPRGMVEMIGVYQEGAAGRWTIEKMFSAGDRVVVQWTGTGRHVGDLNGVPATGNALRVVGIAVHRVADGRIAETWEVWDALGLLQQIDAVPVLT